MLRARGVGQRTKHIEHAWHAERGANRSDETHRRMEGACERERDAAFVADFSHLFRRQIQRQSQRFEAIGGAALGRGGAIAVFDDFDARSGGNDRAHGRQVHRGCAVSAGADDIGGLAFDMQRDGVGDHGLRRAADFIGSQSQLLLGGEHRADGGRIGVAVHEVINEPLGFLGA